jgi:hypothetical protein
MSLWDNIKDAVIAKPAEVVVAAPVAQPVAMSVPALFTSQGIDEGLYQALMSNISAAVPDNKLMSLMDMAETMKLAIIDEGTRIKASGAALKLTNYDVNVSIDQLIAAVDAEKAGFAQTDLVRMEDQISVATDEYNKVLTSIEETIAELNTMTAMRDELISKIQAMTADKDNTCQVFEATANKVIVDLQNERKKIQIYLPEVKL